MHCKISIVYVKTPSTIIIQLLVNLIILKSDVSCDTFYTKNLFYYV